MLVFVGLGISDEKGISIEGLEALRSSDKIFAEAYTNFLPEGTIERLQALAGKSIQLLSRKEVESESIILEAAKSQNVAFVVPGDPLIATTHISLLLAAKKQSIPVKVIHSSSVLSAAIGESGLQAYKFGKTATIAFWKENYKPTAAYDAVLENKKRGLHTLLLLDIDEQLGPMEPQQAAQILLEMEKQAKGGLFSCDTKVVLIQGAGWKKSQTLYLSLGQILKMRAQKAPSVFVVPGRLHFLEEEFLSSLR
ncbi:MAG: diphthine synthase [Candidatus Micrarchaeota archaeon]|nr:diphthine synthase [Candidatus Micrarchaeota archaeon]